MFKYQTLKRVNKRYMKRNILNFTALIPLIMIAASCNNAPENKQTVADSIKAGVSKINWGTSDGKEVYLFTLTNNNGVQVKISNYGATVTSWIVPDKKGEKSSIVLGFDSLAGYLARPPYFGATVGRYGNRIANGKFSIDGNGYTLATNNGKNHLHGGLKGFDKVVWEVVETNETSPSLTLHYLSKDGEEGYPGNLHCSITFTLSDDNELGIEYNADTDKPTVLNLTNHSYFNLTGDVDNSILKHTLMIDASRYTPVDTTLITTGELKAVTGTPFDFTSATEIGSRIDAVPGGYDHNFVLNKKDSSLQLAAVLSDSISGRKLEVFTTEPGIQFYTGNFLNGSIKTDAGKPINKNAALCLETQHFPDSPNKPKFPSTVLRPGQKYHTVTRYKLSVAKN
jgi:aldose 1-epimerase